MIRMRNEQRSKASREIGPLHRRPLLDRPGSGLYGEARLAAPNISKAWRRHPKEDYCGGFFTHGTDQRPLSQAQGWRQNREIIAYYMENARLIREGLTAAGVVCHGGGERFLAVINQG